MISFTLFDRGLVAHLIADWLLQNDWMARNKHNLRHPAGWVHAVIYGVALGLAVGWLGGLVLGTLHLIIDTGDPVGWWVKHFKRCEGAPHAMLIKVCTDQVLHITLIGAWLVLNPALRLP